MPISDAALNLIIQEETGGNDCYYKSGENRPSWPGGASGVTIGIGFDVGYALASELADDWHGLISDDAISALQSVVGIHGAAASSHADELHWIDIPWDAAMTVFTNRDIPKWTDQCTTDLPNFNDLNGDCQGALVSLAYNRGPSWNIPAEKDPSGRYREMRAIKWFMSTKQFDQIPGQFLSMRRLWPIDGDLWKRRMHEAALFQQGLNSGTTSTPTQEVTS